jgi:hypothetical protein
MGTITRTFANNITTSGVFKPTAFNNASFDNVTSVPEGAVEGGSMVLLSTQTASASSSISFTSGIDSTYKEYMFILNNIHTSDQTNFLFQTSTDGGSSYGVTCTTTFFLAEHYENDTGTAFAYVGARDLEQSTSYQQINGNSMGTNNDDNMSVVLHLFNPSDTTYVKHFMFNSNHNDYAARQTNSLCAGYFNTTSAINAIDFKTLAGTFDGTIQMFGIL